MYLADCHNHTCCSSDSEAALTHMVAAAKDAGLSLLCTTDHLDLLQPYGQPLEDWDWAPVLEQYNAACTSCPKEVELRLGIELGGIPFFPDRAADLIKDIPLDFIIGSVHNLSPVLGGLDFYYQEYPTQQSCHDYLDDYFNNLSAMAGQNCFDVMAHIIYPLRSMKDRAGHNVDFAAYTERIQEIMRTLIHGGRGIELNTNRGASVEVWRNILTLYRNLGGEIITLGTDAHRPEDVGKGIEPATELLRELGFRHYTVFRRRKPEFIPL